MQGLRLAGRMDGMAGSAVREILKVTQKPDIISFAGGLPSPESFPVAELKEITAAIFAEAGAQMLQYGVTEGFQPLREFLAGWLKTTKNIPAAPDDIQITSGSQQGIDLVSKVFLDPGDQVAIESPSYLAAFQIFNSYQARYLPVSSDEQGMCTDHLEELLQNPDNRPKLVYTVATFQNPTGITMSLERRKRLLELAERYNLLIVEDNPYGELRYEGEDIPTLKALDTNGRVIYLGSFSKVVAPGLRTGYAVVPPAIRPKLTIAKQAADLHSSNLSQEILYEFCRRGLLDPQIKKIRAAYRVKRDAMFTALEKNFPAGVRWTKPKGGLFLWVELPAGSDTAALLPIAVEHKVAYVPGTPFYAGGGGENAMRVNFSNATIEQIDRGVAELGTVIAGSLKVLA